MHARRIRPDTGPTDRRRLAAAGLSAVLPGLGQAFNGRRRLALWFMVPSLILLAVALLVIRLQSPTRLAAWAVAPSVLSALLLLNLARAGVAARRSRAGVPRHGPPGADRPPRHRRDRPDRAGRGGPASHRLAVRVARERHVQEHLRRPGAERDGPGRDPGRLDRADQRPAARRRQHGQTDRVADRHDDRRVARPGRTHRLDGVGAARPRQRPAGQRRRLRAEAELADVVRRAASRRVPEGWRPDARGCDRRFAGDRHPVLRPGRLRGVRRDGRRGRWRGRRRQEADDPARATTASGSTARVSSSGAVSSTCRAPRPSPTRGSARDRARATSRGPTASSRSCWPCATA